ncbi:MAG TPA: A24 family peptidase [Trebonia sp.]
MGSASCRWSSLLPVTGRCPACRVRIGPPALSVELATGLALAVAAARASSPWELAGLAWLVLFAVPLMFIDIAVHRLPDTLTVAAFAGTLGFLAVAALADGHPGRLVRAGIAAVALCGFYLALFLVRPSGMGLGDVKLAAGVGVALGWLGWQALVVGTFLAFALAAVYGSALLLLHRATRTSQLPLGPFIVLATLAVIAG